MAEKGKAGAEEDEVSDVDDAPPLALRRRAEASDDDEDGGGVRGSPPLSRVVGSDSDSDEQGAAEVYDEDEGSEKCEGVLEDFDAGRGGGGGGGGSGGEAKEVADEVITASEEEGKYEEEGDRAKWGAAVEGEEKEKKGIEPYAVPRIGGFFMHDDRLQNKENDSHGCQREFFGGQKLFYPKDDSVWVHDRFDEINIHDVQHDNTRRPTIPFRAWAGGRTHGINHGYLEGNKSHGNRADYNYIPTKSLTRYESSNNYNRFPKEAHTSYDNNAKNYRSVPRKFHSYYYDKNFDNAREPRIYHVNAKGYNDAPNVYRGKPSRPYHWKNTFGISSVQSNRTYSRSLNEEACSDAREGKRSYHTLNLQNDQRRKVQHAFFSKLFSTSIRMAHSSLNTQSRPVSGVTAFVPSGGHRNGVDSLSMAPTKGMPSPGSHSSVSASNYYNQYSISRDQGCDLNIGKAAKNEVSSTSRATRSCNEFSNAVYQQRSVQQLQPRKRASTQIFHQNIASTNNNQSHPQVLVTSSTEEAETILPPGSKNYVVIGQNDKEESVSASSPHDGCHALDLTEARGPTLGHQGFAGIPAVLPVMQFSGQHPSGPDIPSIGMALPEILAHQLCGNLEMNRMTWLPTLSGATGAFGTTYPPYFGSFYSEPSELPSSSVSTRNHSVTEVPVSFNSHEIPEVVGHELCQRKNKPRRFGCLSKQVLVVLVCSGLPLVLGFWYYIVRFLIPRLAVIIGELLAMAKSSSFGSALIMSSEVIFS